MTAMKMMVGTQHQEPGGFEGRSQKFKDNTSSWTASPQTALRVLRGTYSILQGVVMEIIHFQIPTQSNIQQANQLHHRQMCLSNYIPIQSTKTAATIRKKRLEKGIGNPAHSTHPHTHPPTRSLTRSLSQVTKSWRFIHCTAETRFALCCPWPGSGAHGAPSVAWNRGKSNTCLLTTPS